jgi:protein O-GlcNAc transferase
MLPCSFRRDIILLLVLVSSFASVQTDPFKGNCPKEAGNNYESVTAYAYKAEKAGNIKRAHACYLLAADMEPTRPEPWHSIGEILRQSGNFAEAVHAYRKSISIAPTWPIARFNLASAYKDLHRPEEAISEYKKALDLGAKFKAAIYNNLALAYGQQNNHEMVLENYRAAIRADPTMGELWMIMCRKVQES